MKATDKQSYKLLRKYAEALPNGSASAYNGEK